MIRQTHPVDAPRRYPCWCGQDEPRLQFRTNHFGLVRCGQCGCYRIDPPPLADESEAASFYTGFYAQAGEAKGAAGPVATQVSRFWRVVEQIPELGRVGERVVDIGCGDGRLCAELHASGWPSVLGVDASSTRIVRARQRYPHLQFYDRPLDETAVARGSLDLAVMDNVVEHLPDPPSMLTRLSGYLKSSGRLVIITPNMESGQFRLLGRRWTPELAPHAHIFLFTDAALRRLLAMSGFSVEASGSFHLPIYPWSRWLRRFATGDVKGALWRSVQEMGIAYGRVIGAGSMLFAVARPRVKADGSGG